MKGIFFLIATIEGVSSSPYYSHLSTGHNHYGLHSLIVPLPCQADVLYEQLNYICVNNEIKCLPGWKVGPNFFKRVHAKYWDFFPSTFTHRIRTAL